MLQPAGAHAGAWTQDAGQTLFINQLTYFSSDAYYNRAGDKQSQPNFSKLETQPYVEYGLSAAYTLGASSYIQRDWQGGSDNTGIADTEIFLRTRVYRDDANVLSLQPLLKLPSLFSDNDGTPRGGSHSTDGELSLLYGRNVSLISPRDYLDTRIGYRARSHGLNDQYKADLALGVSPAPNWQIIPALRYVQATSLGSAAAFSENGDLDYDLLKAELAVAYHFGDAQWVQAGLFEHLAGAQTGNGTGVSVGYAVRF